MKIALHTTTHPPKLNNLQYFGCYLANFKGNLIGLSSTIYIYVNVTFVHAVRAIHNILSIGELSMTSNYDLHHHPIDHS